jgi:hypothetical protein
MRAMQGLGADVGESRRNVGQHGHAVRSRLREQVQPHVVLVHVLLRLEPQRRTARRVAPNRIVEYLRGRF